MVGYASQVHQGASTGGLSGTDSIASPAGFPWLRPWIGRRVAASTRHGFRSLTCVTPTASLCGSRIRSGISGGCPRLLAFGDSATALRYPHSVPLPAWIPSGISPSRFRPESTPGFSVPLPAYELEHARLLSWICFHWQAYVSLGWLADSPRVSFQLLGFFLLSADWYVSASSAVFSCAPVNPLFPFLPFSSRGREKNRD